MAESVQPKAKAFYKMVLKNRKYDEFIEKVKTINIIHSNVLRTKIIQAYIDWHQIIT